MNKNSPTGLERILHLTSKKRWRDIQSSGYLQPRSPPYFESEKDKLSERVRRLLKQGVYIVGMLDPQPWVSYGIMEFLFKRIKETSSRSAVVLLSIPVENGRGAFVREHAYLSPKMMKGGSELWEKWNLGVELTVREAETINGAHEQYEKSTIPLSGYRGEYEVPEIWLPRKIPVQEIILVQQRVRYRFPTF